MNPMSTAPHNTPVLLFGHWAGEINGPDATRPPGWYVAIYTHGNSDYPGYTWNVVGSDAYAAWVKPEGWLPLPASDLAAPGGEVTRQLLADALELFELDEEAITPGTGAYTWAMSTREHLATPAPSPAPDGLVEALKEVQLIAVDAQLRATYQKTALERISSIARAALALASGGQADDYMGFTTDDTVDAPPQGEPS